MRPRGGLAVRTTWEQALIHACDVRTACHAGPTTAGPEGLWGVHIPYLFLMASLISSSTLQLWQRKLRGLTTSPFDMGDLLLIYLC
jgi:hypothetical protein